MKTKYKPKFKKGDVVKTTLVLTVDAIEKENTSNPYYTFGDFFDKRKFVSDWYPDSKPFDKIAKLVKPAKKKAKPCL